MYTLQIFVRLKFFSSPNKRYYQVCFSNEFRMKLQCEKEINRFEYIKLFDSRDCVLCFR